MFKSAKRKKSHGFTLAEALIVVAIIGILLAVAIPNVLSYYRSLKLTELDDSARTIFVAAQNRLTAMKSAGANLYALSTVEVNEKPDPGVGAGRFLAVTSAQADSLASLVPGGSIESQLHDNHYVVEIDAKTGAVYAVWYWEKEHFDYVNESYDEVKPEKDKRLDAGRMVGYYGGSFVDRPTIGQTPMPSAQVINAEELKLKISVPGFATGTYAVIKANVTISAGGKTVPIVPDVLGSQGVDLVLDPYNNVFEGEIALDTLDESKYSNITSATEWSVGKSFKNWAKDLTTGAYAIAPGANFDIEVKVTAVDTSGSSDPVNYLPQYLYWEDVNSLFASVEEDSVTGEPVTAKIAYGRHLQNLDSDTSDVTSSITKAEQTRVIDFAQVPGVSGVESWYDTYYDASTYTLKSFTPIVNDELEMFDGKEFEIRNMRAISYPSLNAGLFGSVAGSQELKVVDTYIVDATVSAPANGSAGTLVGAVSTDGKLDVVGCHVWVTKITKTSGSVVSPCNVSAGNNGHVGGLVGFVGTGALVTMGGSFASTTESIVGTNGSIGGLVGAIEDGNGSLTITNSYAAGYLGGYGIAGGLVGGSTGGEVTVENSYAAGIIAASSSYVAGIANFELKSIKNSYAAVRYGSDLVNFGAGSVDFYGVAPDVTATGALSSNVYYVEQSGVTYKENSGNGVRMSELKDLIGTTFASTDGWYDPGTTVNPQGLTYPYKILDELADPYPYPMLASDITAVGGASLPMPHYGDWMENSYATSFYWEKEGTEYKFYLVLSNGTTQYIADNLCTEYHLNPATRTDVEAWGYGLIGIDADAVTDAGLTPGDSAVTNITDITTPLKSFLADTGTTWNGAKPVGPLEEITALLSDDSNVILLKGAEKDDFHAIETGAGYLELNLGFAAAIDVTNTVPDPANPVATHMGKARNSVTGDFPYQIRTVRQLDNIPDTNAATKDVYYEQTHDINGTGYTAGTDGYTGAKVFSGTYDGNSYRILELSTETGGLFVTITNAVVKNVILYSPTGTATIGHNTTDQPNQGGIARRTMNNTESTIKNCIVAGYQIGNRDSGLTGGLVGHHLAGKLIIKNCAAVNTLQGTSVGGLVGLSDALGQTATISELEIIDSYAGDSITYAKSNAGGLVGSNIAGNRDYQNGKVTYKGNVYSYVDISGTEVDAAVYGIGPGTVTADSTAKYWQNGLPSGVIAKDTDTNIKAVSLADLTITPSTNLRTYRPDTDTSHGDDVRFKNGLTESTEDYPFTPVVNVPATVYGETGADIPVHYGDWPDEPAAGSLCYYDVVGGNYGVWGYIDPTKPIVNTLAKGDLTNSDLEFATDDGYCVLVEDNGAAPTLSGVTGATIDSSPIDVKIDGKDYDLYKIIIDTSFTSTGYYTKITVDTTDYWFNPYFACEVQKPGTGKIEDAEPMAKPGAAGEGETDDYNDNVIIRTARQLANLAEQTGDKYNGGTDQQRDAQNRNYVQLLDIDYDKYTGADLSVGTSANKQTPASLNSGSYDGNNFLIRNLYIGDGTIGDGTGLFGRSKGNMSNIRLVNISVESTDNNKYVGALAGRFQGDTLTNCGVYVDSANAPAGISDVYGTFKVSGSDDRVGGLIGNLNSDAGATVTKCFAAVKVEGGDRVGGLIGALAASNNDSVLVDCYSAGHTVGSTYTNDANVTGNQQVGGLIGCVVGSSTRHTVTLSGINYSTCSVKGSNNLGLLIGAQTEQAEIVVASGGTAYATGVAFNNSGAETTPRNETYLTKPTATTKSDFTTHAYDDTLTGDYPYETNLKEHYGDWVMPKFQVSGYIYWELEGSEYHYSVTAWDRENSTATWEKLPIGSTLCNEYDTKGISNYGYGWFYAGDFDGSTPTMTGATATPDNDAANALKNSLNTALETALPGVDLGTVTVEAYSYNSTTASGTAQTWTIQQGSETLQTATLNPDFADTITTTGTVATPYKVRTIRQLQNINHTAYLAQSFIQGHDLDGGGFTYTPIGNGTGDGFTGSYDGQGYRIRNLNISVTGECAGLFGVASGSAKFNQIIMWGNGSNTISATGNNNRARVGGIVAEIPSGSVSISNCAVAGYTLTNSASSGNVYMGGIVANLNGTVTNCEAVVNIINGSHTAYIGGLVGEISSGSVADSYAGGTITTSDTHCVGGVVGESGENNIENCYSYVTGATYAINAHRSGIFATQNNVDRPSCAYFGVTFADNRDNNALQCANVDALNTWFAGSIDFFHTAVQIDGIDDPSATFNGAVVQVPTEPGGDPVYVHYGDLPA